MKKLLPNIGSTLLLTYLLITTGCTNPLPQKNSLTVTGLTSTLHDTQKTHTLSLSAQHSTLTNNQVIQSSKVRGVLAAHKKTIATVTADHVRVLPEKRTALFYHNVSGTFTLAE